MPAKKGTMPPAAGMGRQKGSVNKSTKRVREAMARVAEGNIERVQQWLDDIAAESPEAAMKCYLQLLEYHIPKLARTEIEGEIKQRVTVSAEPLSADEWSKQHAQEDE